MKLWHRKRPGWKVWKWGEWREALEQKRRYKKYNRPSTRKADKVMEGFYRKKGLAFLKSPIIFTNKTPLLRKQFAVYRYINEKQEEVSRQAFAALCNKGCPR